MNSRTSKHPAALAAAFLLAVAWMAPAPAAADEPAGGMKVKHLPLNVQVNQEFGQLVKFKFADNPEGKLEWLDRFGVMISKDAIIDDRILISAGIAGTYLMVDPENISPTFTGSQFRRSYIGPSHGFMEYAFGGREHPAAKVKLGMFYYKYNPEAYNLGEYLFRSMAYPTVVYTGGLQPNQSSGAILQGAQFSAATGPVDHHLFLTTETTLSPFFDFTLSYVGEAKLGGALTLGAGASWTSFLSVNGDKTTPTGNQFTYFRKNGQWYTGYTSLYSDSSIWYRNLQTDALARGDSAAAARYHVHDSANLATVSQVRTWLTDNDSARAQGAAAGDPRLLDVKHYTFESIKLMGRFTFDPKAFLGSGIFGKEDLKIYGEAAVLGLKDYPIFYENIANRIPVMLGVNIPAFKLLDVLAFQVERFTTRFPVSTLGVGANAAPMPGNLSYTETAPGEFYDLDVWNQDNLKWSLKLKKQVAPGFMIQAQAARDHFRTFSFTNSYGHGTEPGDILVKKKHWAWMVDFTYGI